MISAKDPVLNAVAFIMLPFIILFALYIQFHGDCSPGGGFQAGIIISSGIILYSMLFGTSATLMAIPYSFIKFINVLGILIFVGRIVMEDLYVRNYNVVLINSVMGQKFAIMSVELGVVLTIFSSMLTIYLDFVRVGESR